MRRKDLCEIAGIKDSNFNVHRMNGNLPFEIERLEGTDGAGRPWAQFSLHDAARLIAARQLQAQGVAWSEACRILREAGMRTSDGNGIGKNYFEAPGVFVARVSFANSMTNSEPMLTPATRVYFGRLETIVQNAQEVARSYSARQARVEAEIVISGIIAVDLSHCFTLARLIAADKGIKVDGGADE